MSAKMETSNVIIRKYELKDRESVKKIAGDTAFFGEPVEALIDDRELFFDAFYAFFFDHETDTCWVAEHDGVVVGFLAGSVDAHRQQQWSSFHIYPGIAWGLMSGKYTFRRKTLHYVTDLIGQAIRGELPFTDTERFPAHLHINVDSDSRGLGMGRQLLEAYHSHLRSLGVKGVHLHTTDQNVSACKLYEKVGYQIQDVRKTEKWIPLLGKEVENRCYGLDLG
jgi:ribosomal protein S18 acetylase RimI-like enzyme